MRIRHLLKLLTLFKFQDESFSSIKYGDISVIYLLLYSMELSNYNTYKGYQTAVFITFSLLVTNFVA